MPFQGPRAGRLLRPSTYCSYVLGISKSMQPWAMHQRASVGRYWAGVALIGFALMQERHKLAENSVANCLCLFVMMVFLGIVAA